MPVNSRRKGANGERQWRDKLRLHGYDARRGQQFSGSADSPDVVCPSLPDIHWEVKRVNRFDLYGSLAQAESDSGDKVPVVAHRRDHHKWVVVMDADDFLELIKETDLVL